MRNRPDHGKVDNCQVQTSNKVEFDNNLLHQYIPTIIAQKIAKVRNLSVMSNPKCMMAQLLAPMTQCVWEKPLNKHHGPKMLVGSRHHPLSGDQ